MLTLGCQTIIKDTFYIDDYGNKHCYPQSPTANMAKAATDAMESHWISAV